ncbi:hypothetical protein [Planococcus lenghuensis]|uniref:Uncharacterized protein n=1 Tax=Planococcus lenghuensis TaxID=2213202 RepID=A0A1Q2KVN6_9BACL|nr:hypothetical protein [Planococcus lenghuensis]AQQ52260.1 hypothetical protein B0X71_03455 [Planococcus lenghuensis]
MKKTGEEPFVFQDEATDFLLLDFWRWSQSDILNNALRGQLADFIVAKAVNAVNDMRIEWDAYDLVTQDGTKIEVKSAAYLQSWKQTKHSTIQFSIRPALAWDAETNTYSTEAIRSADVYIFCILEELDREKVNPLDLDQWTFYILSARQLDREKGKQKMIGLASLLKMRPIQVGFDGINQAIKSAKE